MKKIVSVQEMLAIEREADLSGLTYDQMMENAGLGLAEEILFAYNHIKNKSILGLIGSGNNGGDALVSLEILARRGWHTSAYIVRTRLEEDPLVHRFIAAGGEVFDVGDDNIHYNVPLRLFITQTEPPCKGGGDDYPCTRFPCVVEG